LFKSIYFKIVLILAIFIITVMSVIGTVLLNSVSGFYADEFFNQMVEELTDDSLLIAELKAALTSPTYAEEMSSILDSYSGILGIDRYRDYFILDMNGEMLSGSDMSQQGTLELTANVIAAMQRTPSARNTYGVNYFDYALYLTNGTEECILYVKDTQGEMQQLSWILFSIVLQSLFFGMIIAVVLSFFLARAISRPIQTLTKGAQLVASGEFSHTIENHSDDEIGTLTDTFNDMKTALKNTLDEADGERQKLRTVFSYLKDAVVAFTNGGKVLHINESAMEFFGKSYDENFDLERMLDLLNISFTDEEISAMQRGRSKDVFSENGIVFHDKVLNSTKVVDVSFGEIKYVSDNKPQIGFITVLHDVTNRYELDKSRREFVANVSHELRTPLTSIKGACETVRSDPEMPEDMRDYFLSMATDECDRMTRIVSDLLILSRLDNNRTRWNIEQFSLEDSVKHICDVLRVDADAHRHNFSMFVNGQIPTVTADKERIAQVIINIISNAIKYTPDGGTIDVFLDAYENFVTVSVRDTGVGIPEADIDHLFERFYRVEKSRTSETGGTGLGLAIAKEIVVAHGGNIKIKSKLGAGTLVCIVLPIETALRAEEN